MTVALAKDVEEFLREQVRAGVCTDPDALVNDLLRSLRDQQHSALEITSELEAWLLQAADQPTKSLSHDDFNGVRDRVRARFQSKRA